MRRVNAVLSGFVHQLYLVQELVLAPVCGRVAYLKVGVWLLHIRPKAGVDVTGFHWWWLLASL